MNRQELDKKLNANFPINAIMFLGESHFLIDRYTRILSNIADANRLSMYHSEYNFSTAKAHLSQGSLFGDRNVLLIKSEKKVPKAELITLLEYVKKNPDNIFIYAYYGSDFKASATSAFSKKSGGEFVRFFNPYFSEAKNILIQHARDLHVDLDSYAATHLLQTQNSDLALACNEIEKLQFIQGSVSTKDIDEMVFGVAEVKIETFILDLLAKKDIYADVRRLLEAGEDEIRVVTQINRFVYELYLFYIYIKINGVSDSSKILGYKLPQFIEKQRATLSISFKQVQYENIINLLLDTELKMKSSSNIDKNALLLSMLIKFQAIL